jgi:hypothetical protein
MSIKIMSWVLDHSPYEGKGRLIHVVLADHANDDGVCWPSQEKIAKRAGCSVEHVRVMVQQMIKDGYLKLTEPSKGRGNSHKYLLKSPKSFGGLDIGNPQVGEINPQVGGDKPPNPSPKNHQEPSRTINRALKCPYCRRSMKTDKAHNCSAMNQLIR